MAAPMTIERVEKYIRKTDSCWIWVGALSGNGYGNYWNKGAHRVMYELIKGAIQSGLQIDHLCRNRACVNPEHLEAVTPSENQKRAAPFQEIRGAAKTSKEMTSCEKGHEYNNENTLYFYREGRNTVQRRCRVCRRKS